MEELELSSTYSEALCDTNVSMFERQLNNAIHVYHDSDMCTESMCHVVILKRIFEQKQSQTSEFYRMQYLRIDNECFDRDGNLVLSEMKKMNA